VVVELKIEIKGSSSASAAPVRRVSLSAAFSGSASAGTQGRPQETPKKNG